MQDSDGAIARLSACALRQQFLSGSLTPLEVAQASLDRMAEVHPLINAVISLRRDEMLQEARASTARYRDHKPLSPIDGIPITIKDNILTCDLPTTWGAAGLRDHRPGVDEIAVARLRRGGALFLGKTNLPAFALEGHTGNVLFGTTRNPWDLDRTPGGSSGGAAASVAAGVTPIALGTDGGGSIRRPASHCGLVGLKPSIGAIARHETLPSLLLDFEVIGPLTRTVDDAELLFNVLAGPAGTDQRSFMAAGAMAAARRESHRILYVPTLDHAPVDREVAASCRSAADTFESLGYHVVEGALPLDLAPIQAAWPNFGRIGLAHLFKKHPAWRTGVAQKYLDLAAEGQDFSAADFLAILETVQGLRASAAQLFDTYDFVITPSAAALPWPTALEFPPRIDSQRVGPRGHAIFTGWVNALGVPALAVPSRPSRGGLPIGIQIVGGYGNDRALLKLGQRYEVACPWADRSPDLKSGEQSRRTPRCPRPNGSSSAY